MIFLKKTKKILKKWRGGHWRQTRTLETNGRTSRLLERIGLRADSLKICSHDEVFPDKVVYPRQNHKPLVYKTKSKTPKNSAVFSIQKIGPNKHLGFGYGGYIESYRCLYIYYNF